jgi:predicted GH43/DUF377 family glycosyl hydrolase
VIEVKIPGVKGAYNATMIEYNEGYLMAFRYDVYTVPITQKTLKQNIGTILLDEKFRPKGPWHPCLGPDAYDPRLLKINDTIYMTFSSRDPLVPLEDPSCILNLCTLEDTGERFRINHHVILRAPFQLWWEKNWPPFEYRGKLLFEYTIYPQLIVDPSIENGLCEQVYDNTRIYPREEDNWNFGEIRGGTPAVLVDDVYLGFFHSCLKDTATLKSVYYAGAYTFAKEPPFDLQTISPKPLQHPSLYTSPKTPLTDSNVLFPGGLVVKNDKIYVCCGENDGAIKILVINKGKLFKSLKRVNLFQ